MWLDFLKFKWIEKFSETFYIKIIMSKGMIKSKSFILRRFDPRSDFFKLIMGLSMESVL